MGRGGLGAWAAGGEGWGRGRGERRGGGAAGGRGGEGRTLSWLHPCIFDIENFKYKKVKKYANVIFLE